MTIGLSADIDPGGSQWDIFEGLFIFCYLLECALKLKIFGCRDYFFGQDIYWNWFDFGCLVISLADICLTYVVYHLVTVDTDDNTYQLLKFVRVFRLARLVRVMHYEFFSELKAMVLGVVSGVRVLFWAIVLLFWCIFFLGVLMNSLIGAREPEFETVPNSMLTVFRCYTDGCTTREGEPLQERLFGNYGGIFMIGYTVSFMFVTVGVFNLIMAIFIDNVVTSSLDRKLQEIGETAPDIEDRFKEALAVLINQQYHFFDPSESSAIDSRGIANDAKRWSLIPKDLSVTREVFNRWLKKPELQSLLTEAHIAISSKAELFDVLDADSGGALETDELINGLMRLRGPLTKTDIVAVRLKTGYITQMLEDLCAKFGIDDETSGERRYTVSSGQQSDERRKSRRNSAACQEDMRVSSLWSAAGTAQTGT